VKKYIIMRKIIILVAILSVISAIYIKCNTPLQEEKKISIIEDDYYPCGTISLAKKVMLEGKTFTLTECDISRSELLSNLSSEFLHALKFQMLFGSSFVPKIRIDDHQFWFQSLFGSQDEVQYEAVYNEPCNSKDVAFFYVNDKRNNQEFTLSYSHLTNEVVVGVRGEEVEEMRNIYAKHLALNRMGLLFKKAEQGWLEKGKDMREKGWIE
jgi:hypothetical protein